MSAPLVNSLEWWNDYFQSQWEANDGPAQTRHFMELLIAGLPPQVENWLRASERSILDWGCALGDGVDVLAREFAGCRVAGLDFCTEAIERARARFPDYEFIHTADARIPQRFDVVVCSNCLEHFEKPLDVAADHLSLCTGVYAVLVPFAEEPLLNCHRARFGRESFPERLGGFVRFHAWRLPANPRFWNGLQLLVLYVAPALLSEFTGAAGNGQAHSQVEDTNDFALPEGSGSQLRPESTSMPIQPKVETWEEVSGSYAVDAGPPDLELADVIVRLLRKAGIAPPKTLLEAGCGSGHLSVALHKAGYGTDLLDFSATALSKAQASYEAAFGSPTAARFILGDLMRLSETVGPGSYDVVWNSGVLEHFSREVLQEAVIQMGAAAREAVLFIVPNPASLLYLAFRVKAQATAQWEYGVELLRDDYVSVIEASGLSVTAHGYCGKRFTLDQLRLLVSSPEDRKVFEQMLDSRGCQEQALYLQYFLCAPGRAAKRELRIADDIAVLDRTFYLDALGAANLGAVQLRKQAENAQSRATELQALSVEKEQALAAALEKERQLSEEKRLLSLRIEEQAGCAATLEAQVERLTGQLAEARDSAAGLDSRVQEQERTLAAQAEARSKVESMLAEAAQAHHTIEARLAEETQAHHTLEAQLAEETQAHHALEARLAEETQAHHALEAQLAEGTQAHHALEARLAEETQAHHALEARLAEEAQAHHALEARLAEETQTHHALEARLANEEQAVQHLRDHAAGMDAMAKELAFSLGEIRTSRRYKAANILWSMKRRPVRSLGRCATWLLGRYKRRGIGLFNAVEAPDPLLPIQNRLQWTPLPTPVEPIDPFMVRARQAPGAMLFVSSVDWRIYLAQRNHHLARQYARLGYISIYDVSDFVGYDFTGFKEIEPNLFLFHGSPEEVNRIPGLTLWTFCYNYNYRERYPSAEHVIYDLIDDFAVHPFDPKFLQDNHQRALREATLVTYVAQHLEKHLQERPDRLYLPNGVDDEHFGAPSLPEPNDPAFAAVLSRGKPIAAYYGAMAEWFDYDLLAEVATLRPDWHFVLIGPAYDKSVEHKPVLKAQNVTWLGPRDYGVLPRYLRAIDVAMIPFQINEITLATSPLKLYEFFAGQKPVVTTPMPECKAYPEVNIAASAEEFAAALDIARAQGRDPVFRAHLRDIARQNSWAQRVKAVDEALAAARR